MSLADIKSYLKARINTDDLLSSSDEDLNRYLNTSEIILNVFFYFDQVKDDLNKVQLLSEEMIFLFNSNIDLNTFYQYEGLSSFAIGENAIKGTVDYSIVAPLVSPLVRSMMEALGIDERVNLPGQKVKNGFTWL